MDNMIEIEYGGKTVKKEEVVPGVVKSSNAFLVRCSVTGQWTYCNQERLDKLTAKFKTIENLGLTYVGRAGKKQRQAEEG